MRKSDITMIELEKQERSARFKSARAGKSSLSVNDILTIRRQQLGHEYKIYTKGSCNESTLQMLYSLIRFTRPKVVFEYGVCHAFGTGYMAQALKDNRFGHIWGFDINMILSAFELIEEADLKDYVTFVEGDSKEYGPQKAAELSEEVDFVFIDGDHSKEGTYSDFKTIEPYLAGEAIVVFHDIALKSVEEALENIRAEYPDWQYIVLYPTAKGLGIFQNPKMKENDCDKD